MTEPNTEAAPVETPAAGKTATRPRKRATKSKRSRDESPDAVETGPVRPKRAKAGRAMAAGVPARDRRLALLRLLRDLKATAVGSARPVGELAAALGYTRYDVYCLAYHKYPLAADGFVKTARLDGSGEVSVYLTPKGRKADPE